MGAWRSVQRPAVTTAVLRPCGAGLIVAGSRALALGLGRMEGLRPTWLAHCRCPLSAVCCPLSTSVQSDHSRACLATRPVSQSASQPASQVSQLACWKARAAVLIHHFPTFFYCHASSHPRSLTYSLPSNQRYRDQHWECARASLIVRQLIQPHRASRCLP